MIIIEFSRFSAGVGLSKEEKKKTYSYYLQSHVVVPFVFYIVYLASFSLR